MRMSAWAIENVPKKDFLLVSNFGEYLGYIATARLGPNKSLNVDLVFLRDPHYAGRQFNRAGLNVYVIGPLPAEEGMGLVYGQPGHGPRPLCSVHQQLALAEGVLILAGGLWAVETRYKTLFQDALLRFAIGPGLPGRGSYDEVDD
jgi:hypothetical protein